MESAERARKTTGPHPPLERLIELGRSVAPRVRPDEPGFEGMRHVRECPRCQRRYVAIHLLTQGRQP